MALTSHHHSTQAEHFEYRTTQTARNFLKTHLAGSEEAVSLKKHHQDLKETTSLLVHIYIRLLVYHSLNRPLSRRVLHTVYTHTIHTFSSPFLKVPQN